MQLRQRGLPREFDLSRTYLALGQEGLNYCSSPSALF